jgi:hypothetical protein
MLAKGDVGNGASKVLGRASKVFEGASKVFERPSMVFEGASKVFEGASMVFEGLSEQAPKTSKTRLKPASRYGFGPVSAVPPPSFRPRLIHTGESLPPLN